MAEFWGVLFDVLSEFPAAEAALRRRLRAFLAGRSGARHGAAAEVAERMEERRG